MKKDAFGVGRWRAICLLTLTCSSLATGRLAAQEGLIVEVHTTTRDSTVMTLDQLTASLSPEDRAALSGAADVVTAAVAARLDRLIGNGDGSLGNSISKKYVETSRELGDASTPTASSFDYEVYVRGDLMAFAMGGRTVMAWEAPAGSPARVISPGPYGPQGVPLTGIDAFGGAATPFVFQETGESASALTLEDYSAPERVAGATKRILGTTADLYRYGYSLVPVATAAASARTDVTGGAWVARDSEFRDAIAAFYRAFADGAAGDRGTAGMVGGLTAVMADVAALGVPLVTVDTTRTYIAYRVPDTGEVVKAMLGVAVSTSEIESIRRTRIDDEVFYGDGGPAAAVAPGEQSAAPGIPPRPAASGGCDCSCEAWNEFKALEKASKEEIRSNPTVMAKAMCASQCAMKWISCEQD